MTKAAVKLASNPQSSGVAGAACVPGTSRESSGPLANKNAFDDKLSLARLPRVFNSHDASLGPPQPTSRAGRGCVLISLPAPQSVTKLPVNLNCIAIKSPFFYSVRIHLASGDGNANDSYVT